MCFAVFLLSLHQCVWRNPDRKASGIFDNNAVIVNRNTYCSNFISPPHVTVGVDNGLTQSIVWNFKFILTNYSVVCSAGKIEVLEKKAIAASTN